MDSGRSVLLNQQLPQDLVELLHKEGVRTADAWLASQTDLNLAGSYEQVFVVAEKDRLITVARPSAAWPRPVRIEMKRSSIEEVRTRQGIGGGFMEALVDGVYVEVLAYSNARADTFHKVAKKLEDWAKGKDVVTRRRGRRRPPQVPQVRHDARVQGRDLPPLRGPRRGALARHAS